MPRPKLRRRRRWRRYGLLLAVPLLIGFRATRSDDGIHPGVVAAAEPTYFEAPQPTLMEEPIANRVTLPSLDEKLPPLGTPEYDRRVRSLGLDPKEVRIFAEMIKD